MFKKILVPLDGSSAAEKILPLVRALAADNQSEVVILRVAEEPALTYPHEPALAGILSDELEIQHLQQAADSRVRAHREQRERAEGYARRVIAEQFASVPRVSAQVCAGEPVEEILRQARELNADLIAITVHGSGSWENHFIGSVAEQVVRRADVPVLSIRPQP